MRQPEPSSGLGLPLPFAEWSGGGKRTGLIVVAFGIHSLSGKPERKMTGINKILKKSIF